MTTKQVQKNFKLSAEFGEYIARHPEVLENVPQGANIVFGDSSTSAKIDGFAYIAEKKGNKWTVKARK